jgi:hypothetical protein
MKYFCFHVGADFDLPAVGETFSCCCNIFCKVSSADPAGVDPVVGIGALAV